MSTPNGIIEPESGRPSTTSNNSTRPRPHSHAESSNASPLRNAARSRLSNNHENESKPSPSLSARESPASHENGMLREGGSVKRLKRSSGGFLLDSSPTSSRISRSILFRKSVKGKEKPDESPLSVPKSRTKPDLPTSTSSPADSIQSSGIRSYQVDQSHTNGSKSPSRNASGTRNPDGSVHSHRSSTLGNDVSSFGYDTDPAQIVDMALRLNEGKRQQASAKRFASSSDAGRRVISQATSMPSRSPQSNNHIAGGPVRPIAEPKPIGPDPVTPQRLNRDLAVHTVDTSPRGPDGFSPEQDAEDVGQSMQISRATQNRVAKAKAYFELAYEHRRLLSHLPPIRSPNADYHPEQPGFDSKAYNPLQYARNRKLRFRERHPINSEVEGWHDIEKVRTWVDAVVRSHPDTHHDPTTCIRLPPLNLVEEEKQDTDDDDESPDNRPHAKPGRPKRPKSDWITHPGDLIADAFWTEQGLNKQKVYNRDNEPIYPQDTKFQFFGWRNRAPLDIPEDLKSSSPEVSPTFTKKAVGAPPDLPTFESAHKEHSWARTRSKFGKTLKKTKKPKKKKKNEIFDTSSESSDSGTSVNDDNDSRGRQRLAKGREKLDLSDGDPFARPIRTIEREDSIGKFDEIDPADQDSQRPSIDRTNMLRYLQRSNTSQTNLTDETDKTDKVKHSKRRKLLDTIRLDSEYAARSSFEYDSTAPGTPIADGFPSIAINLSPPDSRETSPSRKGSTSLLGVFKDKALSTMNSRESKDHVDRTDFAHAVSNHSSRSRSSISRSRFARGPSPMSRGISPANRHYKHSSVDESAVPATEVRVSNIPKVSSRQTEPHRHRVRGIFKGGRIAELVGNEVSKAGNFIFKKEPPRPYVADGGSTSGYESDSDRLSDDGQNPVRKTSSRNPRESLVSSQPSVRSLSPSSRNPKPPASTAPQYHIQGLPSFTSPFQRDREVNEKDNDPQSPGGTPTRSKSDDKDFDPVSTGAAASRAGRSPRFDRLAPPKLDIISATPENRRSSYGFGEALDLSRTLSASQTYNNAINGVQLRTRESTRLSSVSLPPPYFKDSQDSNENELALTRTRSSTNVKQVTIHDYARLRGLLASVAAKATNIAAYCDEIPRPQSAFLYTAFETTKASGSELDKYLPAPRKQEHVVAARHLIGHLNYQSGEFNDRLTKFTSSTTIGLQREIQILEDKTESNLFPRLQRLSDEVGQLAQKLTTTSTLAVRTVNDEVTDAARLKRRGPYRLSRLLWFKLIEWGVVGLLWGIWLVVMIIRLMVGTVRGIWALIAWLFWLR